MAEPPPSPRRPASPDRRKLLVAGAYAAANAAVILRLGRDGGGTDTTATVGGDATNPTVPPTLPGVTEPPDTHTYELVIRGGRVIDPDSGFDRVADVGIDGGTIAQVKPGPLQGRASIDAAGKVVSPGFIDILSYEPDDVGAAYKIRDGVTTNLGMHGINANAGEFFDRYGDATLVHYGGAFDHPWIRNAHHGLGIDDQASPEQIAQMADTCRQQISEGWIGVDFEPEYAPGTSFEEMVALARVAAEAGVPCFFHGRQSAVGTNAATLDEIVNVAKETGAAVHVEHIISTGGTYDMANSLARLQAAIDQGYDVTACMYPYNYWATYLGSPRFNDGWQERFRITYSDLQVAGTTERLNESTFAQAQSENLLAAAYAIPEADVETCLRSPIVMIGSDAIYTDGNNHPRATGCFARTLGRYVRDNPVIGLVEALGKMTIMPARRLEARAPALAKKGRMQIGADADVTIFDPAAVIDRSTVADPAQPSAGIEHVIIGGRVVLTPDGTVDETQRMGRPVRG